MGSKFRGLLDAARERESVPEADRVSEPSSTQVSESSGTQKPAGGGAKKGRPPGKRSDPDYDQYSVHLRKKTHTAVKIELLREGEGREVSELVETLLGEWLAART